MHVVIVSSAWLGVWIVIIITSLDYPTFSTHASFLMCSKAIPTHSDPEEVWSRKSHADNIEHVTNSDVTSSNDVLSKSA